LQKRKKVEGPILRTKQHFTYKYKSKLPKKGEEEIYKVEGGSLESKKKRET
jgi:hypothetical protein